MQHNIYQKHSRLNIQFYKIIFLYYEYLHYLS